MVNGYHLNKVGYVESLWRTSHAINSQRPYLLRGYVNSLFSAKVLAHT